MKLEVEGIPYPCVGKDGDFEAGPAGSQAGPGFDLCPQGELGSHSQAFPQAQRGSICVLILGWMGLIRVSAEVGSSGFLNAGAGFVLPPPTMNITPQHTGWAQQT